MCWNKEVSITTFIIAAIGVFYLYFRNKENDRWVAIFAGTIAMIQLAEYFMWDNNDCGNKINKYASIFALLVLALEPLSNIIGGLYFSNTPYKKILKYMLLSYIIFMIFFYFSQIYNKKIDWCGSSQCNDSNITSNNNSSAIPDCNLKWLFIGGFNYKLIIIWIMFLLIPFLTMTPEFHGILLVALGILTYGMAALINPAARGSIWCWLAIGIIFSQIILNKT